MKTPCALVLALAVLAGTASAAPNVVNTSQKGSLLIFAHIDVTAGRTTIVRLVNDGDTDVKVKCVYSDAGAAPGTDPTAPPITHKNWTDFVLTLTPRQPLWFDAATGYGSNGLGTANSFPSQFGRGELICFAITNSELNKRKYNHLAGTATNLWFDGGGKASEYTAHAFFARTISADPKTLTLDGVEYDFCPTYLIGQFMPAGAAVALPDGTTFSEDGTRLAIASCTQFPIQDGRPVFTKLEFEVWNGNEVKFTGAYRCADSWWDTDLFADPLMYNAGNFGYQQLGTTSAYYRAKGVGSVRCEGSQEVGLIGTQTTFLVAGRAGQIEHSVTHAGCRAGSISWDLGSVTEEGRVR